MNTNPNDVQTARVTPDLLDAMFRRTTEQALAERQARLRAAEWPGEVEQLLTTLAGQSRSQADALRDVHDRLTALETAMGIARG